MTDHTATFTGVGDGVIVLPGETIYIDLYTKTLSVKRDGKHITISVTVRVWPEPRAMTEPAAGRG